MLTSRAMGSGSFAHLQVHLRDRREPLAARVSGIDVERHIVLVYMMAGLLSGLSGIGIPRAQSAARPASASNSTRSPPP